MASRTIPQPPTPPIGLPGKFVRFEDLASCPRLKPRPTPSRSDDVRPDDIRVAMALGDSITAALLAKGDGWAVPWGGDWVGEKRGWGAGRRISGRGAKRPQEVLVTPLKVEEYRGVSYAIGGDTGVVTLPNILKHYTNATGASLGHRAPVTCGLLGLVSPMCIPHDSDDNFNAAVSGSTASALSAQVRDYLIPTYLAAEKRDGWAFLNIGIGANDICAFCLSSANPIGPGTPEEFAGAIRDAVQLLRNRVPKLIVNIMGVLRVSAIYELTHSDPYCSGSLPIHHLPLECNCALLPGPVGDYTRRRMDELADAYDAAVVALIRQWDAEGDETFAAVWQPSTAIDLAHYPIEALSPMDCFHPSAAAHARLAAGMWNRLTMDMPHKATPFPWEDDVYVRCLEEDDRIRIRQL